MENAEPYYLGRHEKIGSEGHKHSAAENHKTVFKSVSGKPCGNSRDYYKSTAYAHLKSIPTGRIKIKIKTEDCIKIVSGVINYHTDKRKSANFIKEEDSSAFCCQKKHLLLCYHYITTIKDVQLFYGTNKEAKKQNLLKICKYSIIHLLKRAFFGIITL